MICIAAVSPCGTGARDKRGCENDSETELGCGCAFADPIVC